jgi:hypothetical protein
VLLCALVRQHHLVFRLFQYLVHIRVIVDVFVSVGVVLLHELLFLVVLMLASIIIIHGFVIITTVTCLLILLLLLQYDYTRRRLITPQQLTRFLLGLSASGRHTNCGLRLPSYAGLRILTLQLLDHLVFRFK